MISTAKFMAAYLRGGQGAFSSRETVLQVDGVENVATLYLPPGNHKVPGWVVLHGLTVPGRHHASLGRFARSLASSGAAVLVPDIPSWRKLRLDLAAARHTLVAGAQFLSRHARVESGRVGSVGFSFGATQSLAAAGDESLRPLLRGLVAFGGYCDPARMIRALFTGEHEWQGVEDRFDPDPYGRWIVMGNYLTRVPGFEGMRALQAAALELALESGRNGAQAWLPVYDPLKLQLRGRLSPDERDVWDVLVPQTTARSRDLYTLEKIAEKFAAAVPQHEPHMDARPKLPRVRARVVLSHGRANRLIPYTETLRLAAALPPAARATTNITGLFAHSTHAGLHPVDRVRETFGFVQLLNRSLGAV